MMNRIVVAFCALVCVAGAAFGQASDAIEDVIGSQLEAFTERDVTEAFSFASPMIKGMFRDPETFGTMVERGYPMVWDNTDVQFLELRRENGRTLQRVMITDTEGALHMLDYAMIETADGWQIAGVQLVQPDLSA